MKHKLLLVSNMYPNAEYPTHGIFVKDIFDSFDDANYTKYKCILHKQSNNHVCKFFSYLFFQIRILIKIILFRPDYVYCHFVSHVLFVPVFFKMVGFNFKLVGHVHGSDVHRKSHLVFKLLNYCDAIVVPSKSYRAYLSNNDIETKKIFVSPSGGVRDSCYTAPRICKSNNIGFVGRLVQVKRPDRFKSFMQYSTDNRLPFNFIVFGSGELISIFQNSHLSFDIYPPVHRDNLPFVFKNMDFILITSDRESLCLVAIEAMANGVIVIANSCGGVSDYIVSGVNGFIVDMSLDNWEEQVASIVNIDFYLYKKISAAGFNTALSYKNSDVSQRLINNVFI